MNILSISGQLFGLVDLTPLHGGSITLVDTECQPGGVGEFQPVPPEVAGIEGVWGAVPLGLCASEVWLLM